MLPSINLRIDAVIKALEQVVLPALPARERLASDQIRLCVGHLRMIGRQWPLAGAFEGASLASLIDLGDRLMPLVDALYRAALSEALAFATVADWNDLSDVRKAVDVLGRMIDRIILGDDGKIALSPAAWEAILAYGESQSLRERTWFAMNGLDPGRGDLPEIEKMMEEVLAQCSPRRKSDPVSVSAIGGSEA